MSLISEYTSLHIHQIVCLTLLKALYIALQLHFLSLQEIARVVFIRQCHRHNVQFLQAIYNISSATHGKHFQHAVLCTVVRILGTTFALSNPHVLVLLRNSEVNVSRHSGRRLQHLTHRKRTLHYKRFIYADYLFNPRINQQVISYCNLHSSRETVIYQSHRNESRVEHNVTVIRDERIATLLIRNRRRIHIEPIAMLTDNAIQQFIKEVLLHIEVCLTLLQLSSQHLLRHTRHNFSHYRLKRRIG